MPAPRQADAPTRAKKARRGSIDCVKGDMERAALTPVCDTTGSRLGCVASTLTTSGLGGLLRDARLPRLVPTVRLQ